MLNLLENLDKFVFTLLPPTKKLAWFTVISLFDPKKQRA